MSMNARFSLGALQIALVALSGLASGPALKADLLITCAGCSSSTVGGTAIVASSSVAPPDLTILRSPNDNSGLPQGPYLTPVVLIPNNTVGGASLFFTATIVSGGVPVAIETFPCDTPCAMPSLGVPAQWSTAGSSFLTDYFGDTQPSGPSILFDNLIAATHALDASASGYFVYAGPIEATVQFAPGTDPEVKYSDIASFPVGTIFAAFLSDSIVNNSVQFTGVPARDSTGVAGSLIGGAPATVPEPSFGLLLGTGLLGCVCMAHRHKCFGPNGRCAPDR
jgi:hypothetical protein